MSVSKCACVCSEVPGVHLNACVSVCVVCVYYLSLSISLSLCIAQQQLSIGLQNRVPFAKESQFSGVSRLQQKLSSASRDGKRTYTQTCTCACMYVCMHACMCACMYVRRLSFASRDGKCTHTCTAPASKQVRGSFSFADLLFGSLAFAHVFLF